MIHIIEANIVDYFFDNQISFDILFGEGEDSILILNALWN